MQEGKVVKVFQTSDVEIICRYPRWTDLDAFIDMHLTLTWERVMCRRLKLDRDSGGRMLKDILIGLKTGKSGYLFVERQGELVGEGFTNPSGYNYYTVGLALVRCVQGMGIGTQLMWGLEEESRRLGAKRLHLTVWSENHAAVRVYRKVGYTECGRRPGWIRIDNGSACDLLDMTKVIPTG